MTKPQHWLDLPVIEAPDPKDRSNSVRLRISGEFVQKNAFIRRRTPIFQLWTHVIGKPPPINNIGREFGKDPPPTLMTLHDATAGFMGVNRPYHDDDNGTEVAIYVLTPQYTLKYEPDMVCVARTCHTPIKSVLTVQVRYDKACQDKNEGIHGMLTRLEFVTSDARDPSLPKGYDKRYSQRLWHKK